MPRVDDQSCHRSRRRRPRRRDATSRPPAGPVRRDHGTTARQAERGERHQIRASAQPLKTVAPHQPDEGAAAHATTATSRASSRSRPRSSTRHARTTSTASAEQDQPQASSRTPRRSPPTVVLEVVAAGPAGRCTSALITHEAVQELLERADGDEVRRHQRSVERCRPGRTGPARAAGAAPARISSGPDDRHERGAEEHRLPGQRRQRDATPAHPQRRWTAAPAARARAAASSWSSRADPGGVGDERPGRRAGGRRRRRRPAGSRTGRGPRR